MVDFIEKGNRVWVHGSHDVEVGAVDDNLLNLWMYADRHWNNNLLSLPRF